MTATASAVNGFPGRRRRITSFEDSAEEEKVMELQETTRIRDREVLKKKDRIRDRDFTKRRRVVQQQRSGREAYGDDADCTDASDEEYCDEEVQARIQSFNRTNQPSPPFSSFSNTRRCLHTHRSSPRLKASVDETIGVLVPRRARSASTKRLQEYVDSNGRVFSPPSVPASRNSIGVVSPASSGPSKKKNRKSAELRTCGLNSPYSRPASVIQDDIEIEVVEALFDLMKQSQSLSQIPKNIGDEALKKGCEDDNNEFSVRCGKSIKAEAEVIMDDSIKEPKKEKFPKDSAVKSGHGFLNVEKVGSPNSEESKLCCVRVNELESQDPTVTKASSVVKSSKYSAAYVVDTKEETRLEIDLMGPQPLPSSPGKDVLYPTAFVPKFKAEDIQTEIEKIITDSQRQEQKTAVGSRNLFQKAELGNFYQNLSRFQDGDKQPHQQWLQMEEKKQCTSSCVQTSLSPFQISMSGWPGVLPHPQTGFITPPPVILPGHENTRFPTAIQPPKFKFSQSRQRRCATHQYIARNIHNHQQLVSKSLGSGSTCAATSCQTVALNLYPLPPTQNFFLGDVRGGNNLATVFGCHGKEGHSEVPVATNAMKNKEVMPQKGALQTPSSNVLHTPTLILPFDHHQTTVMAPANLSGPAQTASVDANKSLPTNPPAGNLASLPLPIVTADPRLSNPSFPSKEVSPYMAILRNNGLRFPTPVSMATPLKGGRQSPDKPIVNSSFYSSQMFNVSQNQRQSDLRLVANQNFSTLASAHSQQAGKQEHPLSQSHSKFEVDFGRKGSASLADASLSNTGQTCLFPVQAMNFGTLPQGSMGSTMAAGIKHFSSKDVLEFLPQAFDVLSGSNASAGPINFASIEQNSAIFQMLPELPEMTWNGYNISKQKGSFQASDGKRATVSRQSDVVKGSVGKSQRHGCKSSNLPKAVMADIPSIPMMGSSMVDGLSPSLNLVPSVPAGNQHPFLSSSVSYTSAVPSMLQSLHQHKQQQVQFQKHCIPPMQQTGTVKAMASTLSQVSVQHDTSPPNHRIFPRAIAPKESVVVNNPEAKSSQCGETDSAIRSSMIPFTSFQEHIIDINHPGAPVGLPYDSSSISKVMSRSHGSPTSDNTESTIPALPSQQTNTSSLNEPGQKSSLLCRRNVASILSTCPGQLSELKY